MKEITIKLIFIRTFLVNNLMVLAVELKSNFKSCLKKNVYGIKYLPSAQHLTMLSCKNKKLIWASYWMQ